MFGLGFGEILIILVFALIFIGPKKLPELAKNIGKGLREFQRAKDGLMEDIKNSTEVESADSTSNHLSKEAIDITPVSEPISEKIKKDDDLEPDPYPGKED